MTAAPMPNDRPSQALFHVKLPYARIGHGALGRFLERGLRPEICFSAQDAGRLEPEDVRPMAEALAAQGLSCTVHAPFLELDFGSAAPEDRARASTVLERTLRLAEALRPVSIVVHGGPHRRLPSAEFPDWNERALPLLERTARAARDMGLRIVLENICHERPEQLAPLLEALDGAAGWCLDAGHMNVFTLVEPEAWVERLGRHLGQLHLHDNDGSADQHRGVGQGRVKFARLFAALARLHAPRPVATLEVGLQDVDSSLEALAPFWPWSAS